MSGVQNWASIRGRSRLRVVAEARCTVCEGAGVLRLVSTLGVRAHPAAGTPCVHCDPIASGLTDAVEVRPLPMRNDQARTA